MLGMLPLRPVPALAIRRKVLGPNAMQKGTGYSDSRFHHFSTSVAGLGCLNQLALFLKEPTYLLSVGV